MFVKALCGRWVVTRGAALVALLNAFPAARVSMEEPLNEAQMYTNDTENKLQRKGSWLNHVLTFLTCCLRVLMSKNPLGALHQMEDEMLPY